MPRKSKSQSAANAGTSSRTNRVKFEGFINYRPTDSEKKGFTELSETGTDTLLHLDSILDSQYKLGVSLDSENQSVIATLFDKNPKSQFAGYILSIRGGDSLTAIRRLLYVHVYVLEGDWISAMDTEDADRW